MSLKNAKTNNTGPPQGDNRKVREGFKMVEYIGDQPAVYIPFGGTTFQLNKGEAKELPGDLVDNLITQVNFTEGK